jgi:hypothetical protein
MRRIDTQYTDPVELIWLRAAERLGMLVVRSDDVYASWDGAGTLSIAREVHFDADDCLAQMLLHEICHALVAGERRHEPDWGLGHDDVADLVFEHATHRLQAALAQRHGLREFMAVTTEWRPYWDALPETPLADGEDPAIAIAQRAHRRAAQPPFNTVLEEALRATAQIADVARAWAAADSLWTRTQALHASGFPLADAEVRCGDCAWAYSERDSRWRCRRSKAAERLAVRVEAAQQGCDRFEVRFAEAECGACGACCRQGFDLVQVRAREPFRKRHPEHLASSSVGLHLPRPGGRCPLLQGDGLEATSYRCADYEHRPRACEDFPVAGDACLLARRRVGLSR